MSPLRTLIALSGIVLIAACATTAEPAGSPGTATPADAHAGHHPADAASAPASAAAPMQDRMKAMRGMHEKMMMDMAQRQQMMESRMDRMQVMMDMMMQRLPAPGAAPAAK